MVTSTPVCSFRHHGKIARMAVLGDGKGPWTLLNFIMSAHTKQWWYLCDTGVKRKRLPRPEVSSLRRPPCSLPLPIYNPSIAPNWKTLPTGITEFNPSSFLSLPSTPTTQPNSQLKKKPRALLRASHYPSSSPLCPAVLVCELHSLVEEDSPSPSAPFSSALSTMLI